MQKKIITLQFDRETKNKVRYFADEPETVDVDTIYIRKSAFGKNKWPQNITITVESSNA